jgi:hypothetical protein
MQHYSERFRKRRLLPELRPSRCQPSRLDLSARLRSEIERATRRWNALQYLRKRLARIVTRYRGGSVSGYATCQSDVYMMRVRELVSKSVDYGEAMYCFDVSPQCERPVEILPSFHGGHFQVFSHQKDRLYSGFH